MKPWRRRWERYRRQNRFLLAIYVALALLAAGGFLLFSRMRGLPAEELTNRLLIFLLWWFDLTLIAILGFVLLRNLTKLVIERRFGVLGSRFRTKLMLSYLLVILAPTLMLFLLGASLLSHAASSWFSAPVEGMAAAGVELAEGARADVEDTVRQRAASLARELDSGPQRAGVEEVERLHRLLGDDLTGLWRDGVALVELVNPRERALLRLPAIPPEELAREGQRTERFGGTVVVRAWHPLEHGGTVVVGEALPEAMVEAQQRLAVAGAEYETLKLQRPTITATAVLGFGGLVLIAVFAAVWLGLYLSRRFTRPLLALVATTERAAGGDELEEVPLPAEDEVGLLVRSFNAMVRRLREKEGELRSTVRRLDAVLNAVRTGILTLDAERVSVTGNPAAAALLGVPGMVAGPLPLDALAGAGRDRLVETIRDAEGPARTSLALEPGGVSRTVEMAVVPLGRADAPEGWVVALEDMTALLRAQRQAAWSEVARRIAHQIKNPLTPIRLAAERIARHQERGRSDLAEVVQGGCKAIVEHVQSMQEMVDAFSSYARLPAVVLRPVPLAELARNVVSLYDGVKPGIAVTLENAIGDDEVMLDRELFRQVLANLLDNAVEATPNGGRIVVSLRHDGVETVVEVVDQGQGFAVEDQELLFQPFFSTKGRGSGVGLALVQRIVTDHGGSVRLAPAPSGGVVASVRLPGGSA